MVMLSYLHGDGATHFRGEIYGPQVVEGLVRSALAAEQHELSRPLRAVVVIALERGVGHRATAVQ